MKYTLKIYRGVLNKQYFEEFELEYKEGANIISALMQIQKNPINKKNKKTTPISFEMSCLEEVCGACSMLINGYPRQACSALIEPLIKKNRIITLAPLSKFYLIRDLVVDRNRMFEQMRKMKNWIEANDINPQEFGVKISSHVRDALYVLSKCMTCGLCLEACPQYKISSKFIGPFAIAQIHLFNQHPLGKNIKDERFEFIVGSGGIADCGNAQNCNKVCPKEIPLTQSIAYMGREATKYLIKNLIRFKKKKHKKDKN